MKRLLILVAVMAFAVSGHAQMSFDVRAGMNVSTLFTENGVDDNPNLGFRIGAGMTYMFSDWFALHPVLNFTRKGSKLNFEGGSGGGVYRSHLYYLELPVNAQFRVQVGRKTDFVIETGPYVACGVLGQLANNGEIINKDGWFGEHGYKYFDMGWNVGIGFEFSRVFVGIDSQVGITGITREWIYYPEHNLNAGLVVAYRF